MEYLETNLTKEVKYLYTKNHQIFILKSKEETNKWQLPMFMDWKANNYLHMWHNLYQNPYDFVQK